MPGYTLVGLSLLFFFFSLPCILTFSFSPIHSFSFPHPIPLFSLTHNILLYPILSLSFCHIAFVPLHPFVFVRPCIFLTFFLSYPFYFVSLYLFVFIHSYPSYWVGSPLLKFRIFLNPFLLSWSCLKFWKSLNNTAFKLLENTDLYRKIGLV